MGMDSHALPVGARLSEFEIEGVLGLGGFGIVYLAMDHSLHRRVAIKEYLPGSLAHRDSTRRIVPHSEQQRETFEAGLKSFIQEARLLAQFDHPALVKVFRFWEANGTAYMATKYYEGVTLKRAYAETRPGQGEIVQLVAPVLDAVEIMHRARCFHRDIAPDNVIVQPGGEAVLLDLGAARRIIGEMTQALTVVLKSGYAPIEQYADDNPQAQGPWTDVYALAAMIHWMIRGKSPPTAVVRIVSDPYVPLARDSPAGFDKQFVSGVDRALSMKPEARPQSIAELRAALGMPATLPARAPPPLAIQPARPDETTVLAPPPRTATRPSGRRRNVLVFVGVVAIATVLTILIMLNVLGPIAPEVKYVAEAPKPQALPAPAPPDPAVRPAELPAPAASQPLPSVPVQAPKAKAAPSAAPPAPPAKTAAVPKSPDVAIAKVPPKEAPAPPPPSLTAAEQFERGRDYEIGRNGVAVGLSEAARWYRLAADQGHAGAQNGLGYAYQNGRGVGVDYAEARKWLEKSAANGNLTAQSNLGLMYRNGQGVARDYAVAVEHFRKSADGGNTWGQVNLGWMLESGLGVTRDASAAAELYRKSANAGNPEGMYNLARLYERGDGVRKDIDSALFWFRAAAVKGHQDAALRVSQIEASAPAPSSSQQPAVAKAAPAPSAAAAPESTPKSAAEQYELGLDYRLGRKGVAVNQSEAARLFRAAAEQGHAAAQNTLGFMYQYGQGVAVDYAEARKLFEKSAANGNSDALNNLGRLYLLGQGIKANDVLAANYFRKAADAGNAWGMRNLAWSMENGRGVFRDLPAAVELYRKSANAGNTDAMFQLGRLYERGEGVKKDESEALRWFRMAATGGHKDAAQRVAQLEAAKK